MPRVIRSTDLIEEYGEQAVISGISGIVVVLFATVLFIFRGQGSLLGLATILALGGLGAIGFCLYNVFKAKKVVGTEIACPFCQGKNYILGVPEDDFNCIECNRMVPVQDGAILPVQQVRCGFCNSLNYYSDKTEVLLCESCNHEIPILSAEGTITKKLPAGFAVVDDENQYELTLVSAEHRSEELMACLQSMLALNRNQVKQMLDELPVMLLRGITRKKAEMIRTQLSIHGAVASFEPIVAQEA